MLSYSLEKYKIKSSPLPIPISLIQEQEYTTQEKTCLVDI